MNRNGEKKTLIFIDETSSMSKIDYEKAELRMWSIATKYLPPDAEYDPNYIRMVKWRTFVHNTPLKLLSNNLRLNEDYLRHLVEIVPHLKGENFRCNIKDPS